jgi:prolyl oligopeptidase
VVVFDTEFLQLSVAICPTGKWLSVSCAPGAQRGNLIYLADLAGSPLAPPDWRLIYDGTGSNTQALLKFGPHGLLYAITTRPMGGGRVCTVDPANPHADAWKVLISPGEDAVLFGCVALTEPETAVEGDTPGPPDSLRFLVSSSVAGAARLSLHDDRGHRLSDVPTPHTGPGTVTRLTTPPGPAHQAWFTYTDFIQPPAVYRFSLHDRRCHADTMTTGPGRPAGAGPRREAGPGQAEPTVRQVTYPSEDGTPVPMFLIAPADAGDGPRPTILIAYGGFGATAAPGYSPTIEAWVRSGGIYAIAGVRGGGEYGPRWHAAGRGMNKPNAFADFAAAARWLADQGWTTPGQLAIKGASHSGLMVAVAITRNPELYAAAVCQGALTDMVRYPGLGLGTWWLNEFGSPDNPDELDALLGYSPYHRVEPGTNYPAVLLISARTDPRVGAAHTRKLTAALQHATMSDQPVLLRTEDDVGHGLRTASRLIDQQTEVLAFCALHTGLDVSSFDRSAHYV